MDGQELNSTPVAPVPDMPVASNLAGIDDSAPSADRNRITDRTRVPLIAKNGGGNFQRVGAQAVQLVSLIVVASLATASCSSTTEPASPPAPSEDNLTTTEPGRTLVTGTASPQAIVTLEPTTPYEFPVTDEPAVMDQVGLAFTPQVLLVQAGQTVEFRSSDALHNVRVQENQTQTTLMNVVIPPSRKYEYTFERPGALTVTCDVHLDMRAIIFVTATPFAAIADSDGGFTLPNVAPGLYKVTVSASGHQAERMVEIIGEQTTLSLAP